MAPGEPIAFVFWHRPAPTTAPTVYEAGLAAFHRSLEEHAPPGFRGSQSYRISRNPFGAEPPGAPVYVDWYLLDGWESLGHLNREAVRPPHGDAHDVVAARSAHGVGSIYAWKSGNPELGSVRFESWGEKAQGVRTPDHVRALASGPPRNGGSIWQRQLALGPAPEFCIRWAGGRYPENASSIGIELRPVARSPGSSPTSP